jgi:transcriptional regulator with XRE-family HTH domain
MPKTSNHFILRTDYLKREIERRNMTQVEFAQALGIGPEFLSRLLNGGRQPGPTTRKRLLAILQVGFDDLFAAPEPAKARR